MRTSVKSIHVEPEVLAAWSEGTLPTSEARHVEAHLADCVTCQQMLAVFARTEPPPVGAFGFRSVVSGRHWRWAVPLAAAATVAAIWVAVPEEERTAQLNPTSAPAVSEPVGPAVEAVSTDAAAAARANERAARSDTTALADQQAPESREKIVGQEKSERSVASAQAAAAPAAPAPAQEQDRLRAEGQVTSLLRQTAPTEVASPDPQIRWRILPTGRLERSTNAGKTWEAVTLPQPVNVTAVRAPSAATAIVTTTDGREFRTDDQGKSWNPVQP